jgi:succinate-semialdehyde dehydrogenase/glutarate-semialdehyde dehydrogenase
VAAQSFSGSAKRGAALSAEVEAGMLTVTHLGLALPEVPFRGAKGRDYGAEGIAVAMESYLTTKFVTHAT